MNMFDLNNQVVAAAVCAAGTVVGSLIQLRVVWRKETSERSRGVPVTKKTRRGPVLAVCLLLVGAAVGGFALSQYFVQRSDLESAAVRGQLQVQLAQIIATAERLERATLGDHGAGARAVDDRRGEQAATVTTTVAPCRAATGVVADATPACDEQGAQPVTLCASVPAMAAVTAMDLYARPDDSTQPWTDNRVAPGQAIGRARFADKPFERSDSDQTKQVCTGFSSWDAEKRYSARLVVKYAIAPAPSEASRAQLVPVSAAAK
ncbi:MAG TPA: hypothetical protein VNZ02_06965 [Steroidobacteraceae bacterium]|jgi:hypothetical protein|nr:hypothetical protein [Steroidobacteraceae bacterium]